MMLASAQVNRARRGASTVKFVPPPVGGWNARDDLSAMKSTDAIVLDNMIPDETGIAMREGKVSRVTGIGDPVRTLMEYNAAGASPVLFAATEDKIFDVTTPGVIDPDMDAVLDTLTNGDWSHLNFTNPGGEWLVAVNGADGVVTWSGTAWATQIITGATAADFVTVTSHMSRLWFIEEDSMKVWYLDTNAISGTATSINFGNQFRLGGKLMAMAVWTRDGGQGMDDLAVFISSAGELLIYQGTDPSSDTTWSKVGQFKIPAPVSRRCVIKIGADIGVLTNQGLVALSTILPLAESGAAKKAGTDKISGALRTATAAGGSFAGWQLIEYPAKNLMIINVPLTEGVTQHQYVMNTRTGAWCRFTGLDAGCWSLKGGAMYFADNDGTIWQYTGSDDDGMEINATVICAYTDLGTPYTKAFRRIRPQFFGPSHYQPRVGLRLDYEDTSVTFSAPTFMPAGGALWDMAEWDVASWSVDRSGNAYWQGIIGEGFVVAIIVMISSQENIVYNGSKLLFERGDAL